jgi:hypothetical protein
MQRQIPLLMGPFSALFLTLLKNWIFLLVLRYVASQCVANIS